MENQHRKISGYRDLSQAEIDLMNDIKAHAEKTRELLERIGQHVDDQHAHAKASGDIGEMERLTSSEPIRWHEDAKRALQTGFMYAVRAVAQPSTF
jgi:hypothetical protein